MFNNMEEEKQILEYLEKKRLNKGRKRKILDPRNYLIGVLYHKYGYTEKEIAFAIKRERSSLTQVKNNGWYLKDDSDFINNTKEVSKLFPHKFKKPMQDQAKPIRKVIVHVALSPENQLLLDEYQCKIGTFRKSSTITHLLNTHLRQILKDYG